MPKNNQVFLFGNIESNFQLDHSTFKNKYYRTTLAIERRSGTLDRIPIIVPDRVLDLRMVGENVCIRGELQVYTNYQRPKGKAMLFVYATELEAVNQNDNDCKGANEVFLDGFIYRKPVHRITPLRREITDILVAVSRTSKKIDFIPCICWGRNAVTSNMFHIGTHIRLRGRIQSRIYEKRIAEETELRTTYEVSVSHIEEVTDS